MKNKLTLTTLLLALTLVFVGCSGNNQPQDQPQDQNQAPAQDQTVTPSDDVVDDTDDMDDTTDPATTDDKASQAPDTATIEVPTYMGLQDALEVALADLGVSEDQVVVKELSYDREYDSDRDIFDVDIAYNGIKYEYEISGDLQITEKSQDDIDDYLNTDIDYISVEEILQIISNEDGVSEESVHELSIDLDDENQELVYEIDIETDGRDIEFNINAQNGQITNR